MELAEQLAFEKRLHHEIAKAFAESNGDLEKAMVLLHDRLGKIIRDAQWEAFLALIVWLMLMDDDFGKLNLPSTDGDRLRKRIEEAAEDQTERLLKRLRKTNEKRIDRALKDLGYSPDDDPGFDIEIGDDFLLSDKRAEDIAITEITYALSIGEDVAADVALEFGLVLEAVWETAEDERVCKKCGPLHGKRELHWPRKYKLGPPIHVRCRCRKKWVIRNA